MPLFNRNVTVVRIPLSPDEGESSGPGAKLGVVAVSGCADCAVACGHTKQVLPVDNDWVEGQQLNIGVSSAALFAGLLHSLLLPLAGFVLGAVLGEMLFASEALAIAGAVVGFAAGIGACRKQSAPHIQRIETIRD